MGAQPVPDLQLLWSEQDVLELQQMWMTHSASQLANHFGRSRSAICGKIGRLRKAGQLPLQLTKTWLVKPKRSRPSAPLPEKKEVETKPVPSQQRPPPLASVNDRFALQACTFEELTDKRCHWSLGQINEVAKLFCGVKVVARGQPWCAYHFKMAFQKDRNP